MWDVIVVGGGPGGSAVARKCAQRGLTTLMLEKRALPRDKVCSGMVMSLMAQNAIGQEFGEIPRYVLTTPPYLAGVMLHVPGVEPKRIDRRMPIAWRKDLDYWLNSRAQQSGAVIWDNCRATGVQEEKDVYIVNLVRGGKADVVSSRFIVGADGANSVVRRSLFPEAKVTYAQGYRECHKESIKLDNQHFHVFYFPELMPQYFDIIYKGEFLLLEGGSKLGRLRELVSKARQILSRDYGLDPGCKPLWRDACLEPVMFHVLFSGEFLPAKGNALLVGDAAGLGVPVSGEGMCTALKSGLLAANAIAKASQGEEKANRLYLAELQDVIEDLKRIYNQSRKIREASAGGAQALITVLKVAWETALSIV